MSTATIRRRGRQGLGALAGIGALCATVATPAVQANTVARPTTAPRTGGSIAITLPYGIPDCLDPQKTALGASYGIFSSVVDPLFSTDNKGRIRPYLATGYKYNASSTALTVSLRHGVRFSNGDPFDANAVKYTFDRGTNPATKSPSTGTFLNALKTTQVVDPYTARLVLKSPYRPLLTQLANAYEGILDPKAPPTCQSVVGTGPFKISNVGAGYNTVTVVRNPNHTFEPPWAHNSGPAYLDKITFRSITSDATRVSELLSGGVDISDIGGAQLTRVNGNGSITQYRQLNQGVTWLGYNIAHAPFDRVAVRRAVAQAIDRKALVTAEGGLAVPAYSMIGAAMPFYDKAAPSYAPGYDAAAAQKSLAGGAAAHGRYTFLVPALPQYTQLAELIQAELAQVGLNVTIVSKALGELVPVAAKGQYDLLLLDYGYADPDVLYNFLHSSQGKGAGLNFTNYTNATLDNLLTQGRTTTDQGQTAAIYAKLQRFIDTNVIMDPLVTPVTVFGVRSRVQGWNIASDQTILYQDLSVRS